jgi:hypothetical protein
LTHPRLIRLAALCVVAVGLLVAGGTASATTGTHIIASSGTIVVPNAPAPVATPFSSLEIRPGDDGDPLPAGAHVPNPGLDRHGPQGGPGGASAPKVGASFDGLDFFDSRFANGGNQFSIEPPDQGLCVGNGKVVEIVNQVYQVFDTQGHPLINPVDLNTLFGYPAAINRTTGTFGPDLGDVSCLFDQQTNTFFVVAGVNDMNPNGTPTGTSHVDVLAGADPTGAYTRYTIDATHAMACTPFGSTTPDNCTWDYPHIGADANGVYISVDIFDETLSNFEGVNIYAMPKAELASQPASLPLTTINTNGYAPTEDGGQFIALIPAVSPGSDQFSSADNGTEYFSESRAVFTNDGTASSIEVAKLTNTESLTTATPNLHLTASTVDTEQYGVPAPAQQKKGQTPLADCLGSNTIIPAFNLPCWAVVGPGLGIGQKTQFQENVLDAGFSFVTGIAYANGKLWVTLGSAGTDSHNNPFDGAAWFVINTTGPNQGLMNQGLLVDDGTNLIYPSIAATAGGTAALAFTVVGPQDYPSQGYAGLNARNGTSNVRITQKGAGPQDGFSEYAPFFSDGSPRPRWGDYSAAVADGNSLWIANEYIGEKCNLQQYVQPSPSNAAAFGTCGDTRGALGNWDTRISQLQAGQ